MPDTTLTMYEMNLHLLRRLAADLTPAHMTERVGSTGHTPTWILGHLAVTEDFAAKLLGLDLACPAEWHKWFGPGSKEDSVPAVTKDQLLKSIESGHERISKAYGSADHAKLERPHGVSFFEGTPVRTLGEVLGHLLTVHNSYHLGQLSAWRRQKGFQALF